MSLRQNTDRRRHTRLANAQQDAHRSEHRSLLKTMLLSFEAARFGRSRYSDVVSKHIPEPLPPPIRSRLKQDLTQVFSVQFILVVAATTSIITTPTKTTMGMTVLLLLLLPLLLLIPGATLSASICRSYYRRQQNINHLYNRLSYRCT